MSFGNIIGGLLREGRSGQLQERLRQGIQNADPQGGLDRMLGPLLGGTAGSTAEGGQGSFADRARAFLEQEQIAGMSGAKIGGIGAVVGALAGGGLGGAARGGAMAVLGTLAWQAWKGQQASAGPGAEAPPQDAVDALTHPETERLVLRAMIGAAQADGQVDEAEMGRILGHLNPDEVTEGERATVMAEMQQPVDIEALARGVTRPEVATEVYLAALLTVDDANEAERDYLRRLASALRLEPGIVQRLHRMTGAGSA
ncbi:tellurite resistance TerB family protein [Halodurantibacterium flavum]|uniref:Tellurite resistance TerB family protein n=1 Tax=Halodurantibacterium flavum TaxID=1382802 RepID=A0ABW4S6E1_9RHOB